MGESPLTGVRVVEMTEALAGPYCAMMLGDLGADVVKVERREVGDQSRRWGPPFVGGESAYYLAVNRNKRSLEIDIKDPADLAVLHALVATADIFITNNPRMESLERAQLDPATLRGTNPRLIYTAISGYGHTGPKAGRAGYDVIAQGEGGLMAMTGEAGDGPMRFPAPMADVSAGLYALVGILASLYARDRPGEDGAGQFLDVALVDSQITWLTNISGSFFATGERPAKIGNLHPSITPYQPLPARDRPLILAVGTERLWHKLCSLLDLEDGVRDDPRFATNEARNAHRAELIPLLAERLAQRDADEWVEIFVAAGIPAGPINFPDQTLTDEQILARGMVVELEHPLLGLVRSIGNPIAASDRGPTYRRPPPLLGEHNDEIRRELEGP